MTLCSDLKLEEVDLCLPLDERDYCLAAPNR